MTELDVNHSANFNVSVNRAANSSQLIEHHLELVSSYVRIKLLAAVCSGGVHSPKSHPLGWTPPGMFSPLGWE